MSFTPNSTASYENFNQLFRCKKVSFEPIFEKYYQLKYYLMRNLEFCKLKTSSIPSKTSKIDAFLVTQNVVYELKYFSITYRHEIFFATYTFTQDHLEKISGENLIPKCPYWHHLGVNDTNERTVDQGWASVRVIYG